jgi:TonB family protein
VGERFMKSAAYIALLVLLAVCTSAQTTPSASTDSGKEATNSEVFEVGRGVTAPRAIYLPSPAYSEKARKKKVQGTCILLLVVDADGKPRDISVVRGLGLGLDEQAIKAVQQWRFEPARKDGQPVAVRFKVEVSFRLY